MMAVTGVQPSAICETCGKTSELRPYGPNGENICFECGQKDPEGTFKRMAKRLFGEEVSHEDFVRFQQSKKSD